jgi:hypothetical protein
MHTFQSHASLALKRWSLRSFDQKMKAMRPLLLLFFLAQSWLSLALGQKVDRFIDLYNKRKIDEIQTATKGYISPSFLRSDKWVVRPVKLISKDESKKLVDGFLSSTLARVKEEGDEVRENDLRQFQTKQNGLKIAWKDLFKVASESGVKVSLVRYGLKREIDPQIGILVLFTFEDEIVMGTTLDRMAGKVDVKSGRLDGRDGWVQQIKSLKARVEQDGADQPATAPESKPEGNEKPTPESKVRSQ